MTRFKLLAILATVLFLSIVVIISNHKPRKRFTEGANLWSVANGMGDFYNKNGRAPTNWTELAPFMNLDRVNSIMASQRLPHPIEKIYQFLPGKNILLYKNVADNGIKILVVRTQPVSKMGVKGRYFIKGPYLWNKATPYYADFMEEDDFQRLLKANGVKSLD